ncbi:MAG: AMP-binding protein, partial [Streptosporangiaceae bacterium]
MRLPDDPLAPPEDLVRLFAESVAAVPEQVAVQAEGTEATYRELDDWGSAVAQLLCRRGVQRGQRVIWRMQPSAEAIAALLGILKVGATYVPLDRRNPPARNALIASDCGAVAFVGDDEEGEIGLPVSISTADVVGLRGRSMTDVRLQETEGADLAYIIYTSGTTGRPKGVPVRHESVVALLQGVRGLFDFTARDRWLLFHSLAFDFSVWEIWGAFSTGATLVVMPHWTARSPQECRRFVREYSISVLNQTPTAFTVLAEAAVEDGRGFPDLRYVIFGGEKLLPSILRPWTKSFGLERPRLI